MFREPSMSIRSQLCGFHGAFSFTASLGVLCGKNEPAKIAEERGEKQSAAKVMNR